MFSRLHVLTSLVSKFVPVAMLLAASTHFAMAQTFLHAPTLATGETPTYVASGDLNGDGKPDLVSANLYAKSLSLFLGNGAGKFKPAITISLGVTPTSVAVADFNRDGKQDIAVGAAGNKVLILPGSAMGKEDFSRP
jgi:hypothetical protein